MSMQITKSNVEKIRITGLQNSEYKLDPVSVWSEDFGSGKGQIVIKCWDQAWCAFWPAMGDRYIKRFIVECDEYYIAKNLASIDEKVIDEDEFFETCEEMGIEEAENMDEPWRDEEILTQLYGPDPMEWHDLLPRTINPKYDYLLRIIRAVQDAFRKVLHEGEGLPIKGLRKTNLGDE